MCKLVINEARLLGIAGNYLGDRKLSSELGRTLRLSPSLSSSRNDLKSIDSTSLLAGEGSKELELLCLKEAWASFTPFNFLDGRPANHIKCLVCTDWKDWYKQGFQIIISTLWHCTNVYFKLVKILFNFFFFQWSSPSPRGRPKSPNLFLPRTPTSPFSFSSGMRSSTFSRTLGEF